MTGTTITPNGVSYVVPDDLTKNNGAGHSESVVAGTGETLPRLFAIMSDYLASAGKNMRTTSTSSIAIGTGTKTFVLASDIPFVAGERGVAIDTANSSNYMYFTITSYTSSTKTLVTSVASGDTGGSGTIASWNILSSGQKGDTGATGASFDVSSLTEETTFSNLTNIAGSIGSGESNNRRMTIANFLAGIAADSTFGTNLASNSSFLTELFGKQATWCPAGFIRPSATGGCAAATSTATSSNHPDIYSLDFDATTQEYAQFCWRMPEQWNEGTITFCAVWTHPSTTTNFGVAWDLQAVACSNDDSIDTAFGTSQVVTDTGGTTNDLYITAESSAITVAGTPQPGDVVFYRLSRVTGNGSDTMAVDAKLLGYVLFITTTKGNDA